jgi:hypothetical protein
MKVLTQRPDYSRREQHQFRQVARRADLEPFVSLSDTEGAITEVNPGLMGEERWTLYERWCQWTARDESRSWHDPENHVSTFMILDQKQNDETWLPIAVTILLPLTVDGARHLRLVRKGDPSPSERRNAATFLAGDLSQGPSNLLLVDTWIVRRQATEKVITRYRHYGWANALLLRHISVFWDPDSSVEFKFYCEPDNPKIALMLNDLRFEEKNRNAASGNLFILRYPLDEDGYGPEDEAGIERIKANIRAIRALPITSGKTRDVSVDGEDHRCL